MPKYKEIVVNVQISPEMILGTIIRNALMKNAPVDDRKPKNGEAK
jgi:hypothetical protein